MEREYKSFEFKLSALDLDPTGRSFEGYAAVFGNTDLGGDIIHPGAFAKTLAERGNKVKLLWQHDMHEPLGRITELREDGAGLYVKATISDTARGRDALALLRDGAIGGMSIGYDAVKGGTDFTQTATGDTIRNLRELKLWELSLVTFPMNEMAGVTALKMVTPHRRLPISDRARPWGAPAADARVREWAGATDAPNARYASAFMWHDAEAADQFGSYKLQFADVLDGELTLIPRAVFAVAQRLDSTDIPDADKARIRSVVSQYYADMRSEFEDESIVAPWDTGKSERPDVETKAGRVISKANGARIMAALESLKAAAESLESLLEAAGIGGDDEEPEEAPPADEEMACGGKKPKSINYICDECAEKHFGTNDFWCYTDAPAIGKDWKCDFCGGRAEHHITPDEVERLSKHKDTAPAEGRDSTAETTEAGPLKTAPTDAERKRLLAEINLFSSTLGGA